MAGLRAGLIIVLGGWAAVGCASVTTLKGTMGGGGDDGTMTMPDLFRMTQDQAISALAGAGYRGDIRWDDQLCGTLERGQIVETGEVCRQQPAPAQVVSVRQSVKILVQREDPRHGRIGETGEWHLMPEVVGMPLDEAQAAMRAAGFDDEHTHVDRVDDPSCQPRRVCRTYPPGLERAGQRSDRVLTVGADPAAAAESPTDPQTGEAGATAPAGTTPAAEQPGSYF